MVAMDSDGDNWVDALEELVEMRSQTELGVPSPTQAANSASASTPAPLEGLPPKPPGPSPSPPPVEPEPPSRRPPVPPPPGLETPPASASTPGVASAGGSTPGPAEAAAMLVADDIYHFRTAVGTKRAHRWLVETRAAAARTRQEVVDLTADPKWREYVCSHPHAREIIGSGVVSFEGRFLSGLEPNRAQLALPPPYGHHRFDFVAVRADGTACRLHPGGKADAKPIVGLLKDWAMTDTGASTPSEPTIYEQGHVNTNYGQQDVLSAEEAYRMLLDMYHEHKQQPGAEDANLWRDLTAGASTHQGFPWHRFLMGRSWGRTLFHEGVTSIILTWWEGGPALRVSTEAVPHPRYISWRGSRAVLNP